MFAFALWDRRERSLTLARGRLGEKPLYYGWQGTEKRAVFLFGSETNALSAHLAFVRAIDRDALCLFLRHSYIGEERCIYQGVRKILPGSLVQVYLRAHEPTVQRYWSAADIATAAKVSQTEPQKLGKVVDTLEHLLKSAVRRQMVATVPVDAFLSGGVDSSTAVALIRPARPDRFKPSR